VYREGRVESLALGRDELDTQLLYDGGEEVGSGGKAREAVREDIEGKIDVHRLVETVARW